jgi:glycosyltransferase involved in cell wall biosynthesis
MKIVHVSPGYYPHPSGGTEAYVASLAAHLNWSGHEVVIVAPSQDGHESVYLHEGISVRRFKIGKSQDPRTVYGIGDSVAASNFGHILDEVLPDIVHLHAFLPATSLGALREASHRGLRTVYTFHHPATTCLRSTLMRWGTEVCDGRIDLDRCTPCNLHASGMPRPFAEVTGHLPVVVGKAIAATGMTGSAWTALRTRELTDLHRRCFEEYMRLIDHIVLVAEWTRPILLRNGVPPDKISLSLQALPSVPFTTTRTSPQIPATEFPVRLAMLTRATPVKGIHVILDALERVPQADLRLDIFALVQSEEEAEYVQRLEQQSKHDPRIRFCSPLAHNDVVDTLRRYHLLVIPSQWLEVAPLVILEAFAAGTPVIGSNRGGIAELVQDETNGLLVGADCVDEWAASLDRLAREPGLIARLRSGIKPPRNMHDVASDMLALYGLLLWGDTTSAGA